MLNNQTYFLIIILIVHLANSLKSVDFCILNQQECKGFYDKDQNYEIKCMPLVLCHGHFSSNCKSNKLSAIQLQAFPDLNICSRTKNKCEEFRTVLSVFLAIIDDLTSENPKLEAQRFVEINKNILERNLKDCPKMNYEFKSTDFCLNGQNCIEIRREIKGFGFNYRTLKTTHKINCQCPTKASFKCDQYCTTDSIACDFHKSNVKQVSNNIKHCGNDKTIIRPTYF